MRRFPSIYLFRYENMRNDSFKAFREDQKEHSRQEAFVLTLNSSWALNGARSASYRMIRFFCALKLWDCFLKPTPACRFVMGSNKILRVALGHGEEDEYKKGLSALAEDISGSIGLFFTRLPQDQVRLELKHCRFTCCSLST